jgi:hypothetical protein
MGFAFGSTEDGCSTQLAEAAAVEREADQRGGRGREAACRGGEHACSQLRQPGRQC